MDVEDEGDVEVEVMQRLCSCLSQIVTSNRQCVLLIINKHEPKRQLAK